MPRESFFWGRLPSLLVNHMKILLRIENHPSLSVSLFLYHYSAWESEWEREGALLTLQANIIINDKDRKWQQVNDIFSQYQLSRHWNSSRKTEEKFKSNWRVYDNQEERTKWIPRNIRSISFWEHKGGRGCQQQKPSEVAAGGTWRTRWSQGNTGSQQTPTVEQFWQAKKEKPKPIEAAYQEMYFNCE